MCQSRRLITTSKHGSTEGKLDNNCVHVKQTQRQKPENKQPYKQWTNTGFSEFEIDAGIAAKADEFIVFTSDDDSEAAGMSIQILKDTVEGMKIVEFPGYGHFIPEHMGQETFPELVEEILK